MKLAFKLSEIPVPSIGQILKGDEKNELYIWQRTEHDLRDLHQTITVN